jgi:hypothetical protein
MKIGFFGDSFCAEISDRPGYISGYETYISKLKNHYDADVVNLGVRGSSIYDSILLQIKPFIDRNEYPDVCVFVWTSRDRLFHRTYRNLNIGTIDYKNHPLSTVVKHYFAHLWDWELTDLQYNATLQYFDSNMLASFPKTTKIIHMWTCKKMCDWKHGIEIEAPLVDLAKQGREIEDPRADWALNHLDGEEKNNLMFEQIKTLIDNYTIIPDTIKNVRNNM